MQLIINETDTLIAYGDQLNWFYPKQFKDAQAIGVKLYGYKPDSMAARLFATGYLEGELMNNLGSSLLQ